MKSTPSSGSRFSTRRASSTSSGMPQTPLPVIRMAPKPRRQTSRSPPILNRPAGAALNSAILFSFQVSGGDDRTGEVADAVDARHHHIAGLQRLGRIHG